MNWRVIIAGRRCLRLKPFVLSFSWGVLAISVLAVYQTNTSRDPMWPEHGALYGLNPQPARHDPPIFSVSQLNFGQVSPIPEANVVLVTFSPEKPDLNKELVRECPISTPNAPVAWYKFDGNANDSAGIAHGRIRGRPTYVQGMYDQAIRFDGHNDSVDITHTDNVFSSASRGLTISFWQYGTTSKHYKDTLCCSDYTDTRYLPAITINLGCWEPPGDYNWQCGQHGSSGDRLTGKHRNESEWSGRWNHWAFTKDVRAGKMQIFLNGRLFDSRTGAKSPISGITSFKIGSGWYGGYDGLIDDFRIYNYALSPPEVAYLATDGTGILDQRVLHSVDRSPDGTRLQPNKRRGFNLEHISIDQCIRFLFQLDLGEVSPILGAPAISIIGSSEQLERAEVVLGLVDTKEEFVIETLGPASTIKTLPSNQQIADALGDIGIGTFASPPEMSEKARGLIDIHGDAVIAIIPIRHRARLVELLGRVTTPTTPTPLPWTADQHRVRTPKTLRIALTPIKEIADRDQNAVGSRSVEFQNGEDVLDMSLPETMTLAQLLDLAGEYLGLNYVYDPAVVGNQTVTLKLHGSLKGEMRVKDLYSLLETVLKFKGFAMTRREDNLVTIVPLEEVLDADPRLVDVISKTIQAGDIVITRAFELRYVDVASITNLLQNMKLGVTVSSSEETQTLFVTCYAHRLKRIEQLVTMLDHPGKLRECRFRPLQYTAAPALADRVRVLAQEIDGLSIAEASAVRQLPPKRATAPDSARPGVSRVTRPVYLDADERANRILMIGYEEQLMLLEQLIDALDVAQEDMRFPKAYAVKHIQAQEALDKLQGLDVWERSVPSTGGARPAVQRAVSSSTAAARTYFGKLTEEPSIAVLESTNQLLVHATQEQHVQIEELLRHIDVASEDLRTLQRYEIQHEEAEEVRKKLQELDMIHTGPATSSRITSAPRPTPSDAVRPLTTRPIGKAEVLTEKPYVVVTESTNSLLANATAEQHAQIATIIDYVDRKLPEQDIPYRIYPLENSSPAHVADLLERLIHGTTEDKEGKAEDLTQREEEIMIVPDPNTFSLIVYANKKNQEWIENLVKSLDKRRPQVLIDVTLVEITRTDTFEYDLNIVAAADDAVISNIGIEPIHRLTRSSRLEASYNLLDQDGNPTGQTKAFYSDEKVQALLTAIVRKNYGRVLAKPKILVDDGQEGTISISDETTYVKESVQVPDQGAPITTRDFQPIEAKIELQITPHISEGDLLCLDVNLSRGDFGTRPLEGAPPDKTTSQVTTAVFVPDNHTVILGGLVKLKQSKGGSKVPILGDIPLVGGLFRSVDNSDTEKQLYVFLKANIVRPSEEGGLVDLQMISDENRRTFEASETEFQQHEDVPGIKPRPMRPERVLEER